MFLNKKQSQFISTLFYKGLSEMGLFARREKITAKFAKKTFKKNRKFLEIFLRKLHK
jgi:hypothetical protein